MNSPNPILLFGKVGPRAALFHTCWHPLPAGVGEHPCGAGNATGIPQKESEIQCLRETVSGTDSFLDKAKRYTDITELTPELLRLFIEKIVVHEKEVKWSKHAPQTVEIYYNGIGYVGSGQQDVEEALEAPEPQQTQDTEKPRQAS